MKHTKKIIGLTLALLTFGGVFMAHEGQYKLLTSLVNPLNLDPFSGSLEVGLDQSPKELSYKSGELVVLYPGAKANISSQTKELEKGEGFFSGVLVSLDLLEEYLPQNIFLKEQGFKDSGLGGAFDTGVLSVGSPEWIQMILSSESGAELGGLDLIQNLNEQPPGDFENQTRVKKDGSYRPARVTVGKLDIYYPYSAVYIDRQLENKKTIIYALGGGVEVHYEGVKIPFVIPSNHRVTILDALISERTSQLYYTKLQKDFRLEPFDVFLPGVGEELKEQEAPLNNITSAWLYQEMWREKMKEYAFKAHKTLISSTRQTAIQPVIDFIGNGQRKFALGYPEEKEDEYYYEKTLEPLVNFINDLSYEKEAGKDIQFRLGSFYNTLQSEKWNKIIREYETLGNSWDSFYVSHQAATRTLPSSDRYFVFSDYWNNLESIDTFDKLQKLFLEGLLLDLMEKKVLAKNHFDRMYETLKRKDIPLKARKYVTHMRRGFGKLLKSSSFYQTPELFTVFQKLALAENEFYKDEDEVHREIRLEVARDSLAFLNNFVDKGTNEKESNVVLEMYKAMKVKEIQEKLNRNIFSEKEVEMISFIERLGTSRITRDEIERIKETLELEKDLEQLDNEFNQNDFIDEPEIIQDNGLIEDRDDLKDFFSELELDVYKLLITQTGTDELAFKRLFYKKNNITGRFNINRQEFVEIKTNILTQNNVNKSLFSSVLREMDFLASQAEKNTERENENNQQEVGITQNDRISLSYRQRVLNLLRRNRFTIDISDIIVLDEQRNNFNIKKAQLKIGERTNQEVSFEIDLKKEMVSSISVGTNSVDDPITDVVKLQELKQFLEDREAAIKEAQQKANQQK